MALDTHGVGVSAFKLKYYENKNDRRNSGSTLRQNEKKRETEEKEEREIGVLGVNYYQSAFNSQKEKLCTLAEMLKISKSCCIYHV